MTPAYSRLHRWPHIAPDGTRNSPSYSGGSFGYPGGFRTNLMLWFNGSQGFLYKPYDIVPGARNTVLSALQRQADAGNTVLFSIAEAFFTNLLLWFNVLRRSQNGPRWPQLAPAGPQIAPDGARLPQMALISISRRLQMSPDDHME